MTDRWDDAVHDDVIRARKGVNCYFFFFQAEDGIRDYKVTGVQTCDLPILSGIPKDAPGIRGPGKGRGVIENGVGPPDKWRSEERRVGKECRSRWSPYH